VVREQARSVVRVLAGDGTTVVGAGFLIGPDLVATCAHVVADAVATDPYAPGPPHDPVLLDFPLVQDPDAAPVTAQVYRWSPIAADGSGDVAVLRLHRPVPHGARMPPLRRVDALWDHGFRVLGFPEGLTDGVWTTGRIRGEQGTRWFQLQGAPGDQAVVGGFSGSPVWDEESGAVVGMTVAADRSADTTTAYLIPIDQVLGLDPELLPCPYRGLEPFGEEHAAFFFGRDPDLQRLADAVAGQPLVAVAGASGVGKSSLVRAGLLPRERDAGTRIAELRAAAGTAPATALATALGPAGSVDGMAAQLGSPDPAVRAGALHSLVPDPDEPALLLFVDQFEELAATDAAAARELLLLVAELAGDRVRVVLTVRWESLPELLEPGGPDALDPVLDAGSALVAGAVLVGAMDRARLRDAVVGPAERAPGLSFESGLVDRILDDAGAEPGQLPLVESLLTELWERRTGGSLTVAAYEAAGGVAGAVAKRAEELLAEFPDPAEQDRLRRLLTLLAQPDRDGRFVRRPVPLAELAPELRALVPRLVAGRLLVVQQVPSHDRERSGEILELAHQALIRHWPRLQGWLADDRDFLAWRAQLDQQRERWEAAAQDPGALLRGTALAAASQWLPARDAEVSPADHEYLRRSRVRQRREVRRWRVVTAVLAVLVLAAGTLAVVALDRGNRLDERLRLANAENLAQRARVAAPTDPDLAARLALAAWRADPGNPQARSVLAAEYLALQSVQDVYAGFATAPIDALVTSDDGDTLLLPGPNQGFVVTSGVTSGAPRPWVVPDLEPGTIARLGLGGRALLTAGPDGALRRWDITTGTATDLLPANPAMDPPTLTGTPAVDRLAWVEKTATGRRIVVFDVAAGRPIPNALPPLPESGPVGVHLTADPSTIVIGFGQNGTAQRFEMRSIADGATLWTSPDDAVRAAGGVLTCEPAPEPRGAATLVVTGTGSRTPGELRRIPLTGAQCLGLQVSLDGDHVIEERPQPSGGSPVLTRLIRITDGATFDANLPPNPDILSNNTPFAVNARTTVTTARDGTVSVLRASATSVLRIAATPEPVRPGGQPAYEELTANGRFIVAADRVGYAAYDRATGQLLGSIAGARLPVQGHTTSRVDRDALSLLIDGPDGWVLDRYTIPEFTPAGTYRLPTRTEDQAARGKVDAVVDGEHLYLLGEDRLSTWDTTTGTLVGTPITVSLGVAANPTIVLRPGHPGEVAIPVDDRRAVEIWNAATGQRVARLAPPAEQRLLTYSYAFDATGKRLVALTHINTMQIWDVATQQLVRPPIPQPTMGGPALGFDADGHVVTAVKTSAQALHISFWDLASGREAGSVDVSASDVGAISADERTINLPGFGGGLPITLPLTAQQWRDHLCTLADRPFASSEIDALPPGFDPGSPCS
jgi:hypothetical protein